MTEQEILKIQKRARYVARRYPELADDFAQEVVTRFLEGKSRSQTLDQIFIDYLRKQYGRTGTSGGNAKSKALHTMGTLDGEAGNIAHDPGEQYEARRFDYLFRGNESILYSLHFLEELKGTQIAKLFGLTEARISELLLPIKKKIKDQMILATCLERMEWDGNFTKLHVDWIRI